MHCHFHYNLDLMFHSHLHISLHFFPTIRSVLQSTIGRCNQMAKVFIRVCYNNITHDNNL